MTSPGLGVLFWVSHVGPGVVQDSETQSQGMRERSMVVEQNACEGVRRGGPICLSFQLPL